MRRIAIVAVALMAACGPGEEPRELTRPDAGDAGETNGSQTDADAGMQPDDLGDEDGPDGSLEGTDAGEDEPDGGGGNLCRPNRDGTIERSEIVLQSGLSATFAAASDVTFDTGGVDVDGERVWDMTETFDGEERTLVELRDPSGTWWETTFPDATYATPLATSSDLLGVFRATDTHLELIGVVSPEEGFDKTEIEYDPAVPVLKFPLEEGESWTVETDVSGFYEGIYSIYDETYVFEVDGTGVVKTAFGDFDVLRVRSTLDRTVGLLETTVRSFAFVSECFGTVATVASQEDEEAVEFTNVAEIRRIVP